MNRDVEQYRNLIEGLLRASDRLRRRLGAVVEDRGITFQQYNVLRILRGAPPDGLPTLAIAERMMEQTPGITRLIDRLEKKNLVTRHRLSADRRQVYCRISSAGLELLSDLDKPMDAADQAAFERLSPTELKRLARMLEKAG